MRRRTGKRRAGDDAVLGLPLLSLHLPGTSLDLLFGTTPPTQKPGDLRRIDSVVEDGEANPQFTLLVMEAENANATVFDVKMVEYQAYYTAACAYAIDRSRRDAIWAMTCVGTGARLWIFTLNTDFLDPCRTGHLGIWRVE